MRFAKLGANLTISDINEEGLIETKKMVKQLTGRDDNILTIKLDVSDREAVANSARIAKATFGPVDILINNAGIVQGKQITEMNEKMARLSLVVNCESHIWLIREFIHDMEERNKG